MEKDKRVIAVENSQSLARIGVQIGLVNKVLSDKEDAFLKPKQVVLRCETREGFKEFVIDANINELDLNGNQLISISVEIGQLTNLKKLNLGHNFLTKLSPEIAQLLNLEESGRISNKSDTFIPTTAHLLGCGRCSRQGTPHPLLGLIAAIVQA